MKRKSILKSSVSLFLSFCMVLSLAVMIPAAALADDGTEPGGTETGNEAAPGSANVDRSYKYAFVISSEDDQVTVPGVYSQENGLYVEARNGKKADITVEGEIQADQQGLKAVANEPGSTVTVTVETRIDSGTDDAIQAVAKNGSSVTVMTGNVETSVTGDGVYIEADGKSTVNVTTGDIFSDTGITVDAKDGSSVQVKPNESIHAREDGVFINASGSGTSVAIESTSTDIHAVNEGVQIEVKDGAVAGGLVGDVTSTGKDAFGVWIKAEEPVSGSGTASSGAETRPAALDTALQILEETEPAPSSIPNDISAVYFIPDAEDGSPWYSLKDSASGNSNDAAAKGVLYAGDVSGYAGFHIEADGGVAGFQADSVTVTGGNIGESGSSNLSLANILMAANGGVVTGDVDVIDAKDKNACGVVLYSRSGGVVTANAESITAGDFGVFVDNKHGITWAEVGDITSTNEGIYVLVSNEPVLGQEPFAPANFTFVNGDVKSTGKSAIQVDNYSGSSLIAVAGDVTSTGPNQEYKDSAGISYHGQGNTQFLVLGTVSGNNGIQISKISIKDGFDVTAWAIKKNDINGEIIAGDDADGTLAKSINYIVKLEQPVAGGTISAVKEDGSALNKKYDDKGKGGVEVASENQKVYLKADLKKGYKLDGAYNGMKALDKDDKGYYVMVPRGGGIYLTAVLVLDENGNVVAVQDMSPSAVISLDLAGGTMTGRTEICKAIGKTFVFTEEPVWEGHQFLYWESMAHPGLQYRTGEKFIIQESDTFVAVWQ